MTGDIAHNPHARRFVVWDPMNPRIIDHFGGETLSVPALHGDGLVAREVPWSSAVDCLWDTVRLLESGRPYWTEYPPASIRAIYGPPHRPWEEWTSVDERCFLETSIVPFIAKWGVLAPGSVLGEGRATWDRPADLNAWLWVAEFSRDVLTTIAATESGVLIGEDMLFRLRPPEQYRDSRIPQPIEDERDISDSQDERNAAYWRSLRAQGRGLELQRAAVVDALQTVVGPRWLTFSWDVSGRHMRIETEQEGWAAIALAALFELFGAAEPDVYLCSECEKPFRHPVGRRRPRTGASRFCSDRCRQAARRAANRTSWHRNKDRWRGRDRD